MYSNTRHNYKLKFAYVLIEAKSLVKIYGIHEQSSKALIEKLLDSVYGGDKNDKINNLRTAFSLKKEFKFSIAYINVIPHGHKLEDYYKGLKKRMINIDAFFFLIVEFLKKFVSYIVIMPIGIKSITVRCFKNEKRCQGFHSKKFKIYQITHLINLKCILYLYKFNYHPLSQKVLLYF
ncbi:hypothetical protein BpHYR1_005952 [Brachionus plicatilis]|uniref:Uncharacterized protein n=1 Tax=Brachionus plicatilis TaxID=10195 RepID=A0A3M7PFT2_BRAPC|nr:hypothetical protein BpHYR1_005952 [Brachionus plicatilis]